MNQERKYTFTRAKARGELGAADLELAWASNSGGSANSGFQAEVRVLWGDQSRFSEIS